MIKHISFDVWNTLVTANPLYAQERTKIIAGVANIKLHEADAAYTHVKIFLDNEAEDGRCGSVHRAWNTLGHRLGLNNHEREQVRLACEEAFKHFPPHMDIELIDQLIPLCSDYELSIKSNTNFISGKVLSEAVGFDTMPWWSFTHFSDEMRLCKPDVRFFDETLRSSGIPLLTFKEIMHVGDNPVCDGSVVDYGMKLCLVNNPQHLLTKLKEGDF